VVLLVSFNFIGATKMNEIFDKKIILQDQEIQLLEIAIELRKLTNKIEEQLSKIDVQKKECDKIISDFEKDMEKEMLDDQKKNNKV
jgi:DNA topoisomerase IA